MSGQPKIHKLLEHFVSRFISSSDKESELIKCIQSVIEEQQSLNSSSQIDFSELLNQLAMCGLDLLNYSDYRDTSRCKIAGLVIFDCLLDVNDDIKPERKFEIANHLCKVLENNKPPLNVNELVLRTASLSVGHFVRIASRTETDHFGGIAFQLALKLIGNTRSDSHRFAGALIMKELAKNAAPFIFARRKNLFAVIWDMVCDKNAKVCTVAAEALEAALQVVSQQETMVEYLQQALRQIQLGFAAGTSEKLLSSMTILEIIINGVVNSVDLNNCMVVNGLADELIWKVLQRRESKDDAVRRKVIDILPNLAAAFSVIFVHSNNFTAPDNFLCFSMRFLMSSVRVDKHRSAAYTAIGRLYSNMTSQLRALPQLSEEIMSVLCDGFKDSFSIQALHSFGMIVSTSTTIRKLVDDQVIDLIFRGGLTPELVENLRILTKFVPSVRYNVQTQLRVHIAKILRKYNVIVDEVKGGKPTTLQRLASYNSNNNNTGTSYGGGSSGSNSSMSGSNNSSNNSGNNGNAAAIGNSSNNTTSSNVYRDNTAPPATSRSTMGLRWGSTFSSGSNSSHLTNNNTNNTTNANNSYNSLKSDSSINNIFPSGMTRAEDELIFALNLLAAPEFFPPPKKMSTAGGVSGGGTVAAATTTDDSRSGDNYYNKNNNGNSSSRMNSNCSYVSCYMGEEEQSVELISIVRHSVVGYLDDFEPAVRTAAAMASAAVIDSMITILDPNILEYQYLLQVLDRLLIMGVGDDVQPIRVRIFRSLSPSLDHAIPLTENTHCLIEALNDECLDVRIAAMTVISRVAHYDTLRIMPVIRLTMKRLILTLINTRDRVVKRETVQLLQALVNGSHSLVVPYARQMIQPLMTLLHDSPPEVVVAALSTIGDLAVASPESVREYLSELSPQLIEALNDQSSVSKQETAVIAMGKLVSSLTIEVAEQPYKKYAGLFEGLVRAIQSKDDSSSELRLQAIKTVGLLGVVDIHAYERHLASNNKSDGSALSVAMMGQNIEDNVDAEDTRDDDSDDELNNNNNETATTSAAVAAAKKKKLTRIEKSYFAAVIKELMLIMKDSSLVHYHITAATIALRVLRIIGAQAEQVAPQVKELFDGIVHRIYQIDSTIGMREALLEHVITIIYTIGRTIHVHMETIVKLVIDFADAHLQPCLDMVEALSIIVSIPHFYLTLKGVLPVFLRLMGEEVVTLDSGNGIVFGDECSSSGNGGTGNSNSNSSNGSMETSSMAPLASSSSTNSSSGSFMMRGASSANITTTGMLGGPSAQNSVKLINSGVDNNINTGVGNNSNIVGNNSSGGGTSNSNNNNSAKSPSSQFVKTLRVLRMLNNVNEHLGEYRRDLITAVIRILDCSHAATEVRKEALCTVMHLANDVDLIEFASRIIHPLLRLVATAEIPMQASIVTALSCMLCRLGRGFIPYIVPVRRRIRFIALRDAYCTTTTGNNASNTSSSNAAGSNSNSSTAGGSFSISKVNRIDEYESLVIRLLKQRPLPPEPADLSDITAQRDDRSASRANGSRSMMDYLSYTSSNSLECDLTSLETAWTLKLRRSSAADLLDWMSRLSIELIRQSPSPIIRACSSLASNYRPLARDLFYSSFLCIWDELFAAEDNDLVDDIPLINGIEMALQSSHSPRKEIVIPLLKLAEFMEMQDKGLPIDIRMLSHQARAANMFAKCLYNREIEFSSKNFPPSIECIDSLISVNNQLGLFDNAVGMLQHLKSHYPHIAIQSGWLEKLSRWDAAIRSYEGESASYALEFIGEETKQSEEDDNNEEDGVCDNSESNDNKVNVDGKLPEPISTATNNNNTSGSAKNSPSHKGSTTSSTGTSSSSSNSNSTAITIVTNVSADNSTKSGVGATSISPALLSLTRRRPWMTSELGRLRCLHALGEYEQLEGCARQLKEQIKATEDSDRIGGGGGGGSGSSNASGTGMLVTDEDDFNAWSCMPEVQRLGANAAWMLGKWSAMEDFLEGESSSSGGSSGGGGALNEGGVIGDDDSGIDSAAVDVVLDHNLSFYKAIVAIHNREYDKANLLISDTRSKLAGSIGSLLSEKYSRAYRAMVTMQVLAEMEEVVDYKRAADRAAIVDILETTTTSAAAATTTAAAAAVLTSKSGSVGLIESSSHTTTTTNSLHHNHNSQHLPPLIEVLSPLSVTSTSSSTDPNSPRYPFGFPPSNVTASINGNNGDKTATSGTNSNNSGGMVDINSKKYNLILKWRGRLEWAPKEVDAYRQILAVHTLVTEPTEDLDSWLELVTLCRKERMHSLCENILRKLGAPLPQRKLMDFAPDTTATTTPFGGPVIGNISQLHHHHNNSNIALAASPMEYTAGMTNDRVMLSTFEYWWSKGEKNRALSELSTYLKVRGVPDRLSSHTKRYSSHDATMFRVECLLKRADWMRELSDGGSNDVRETFQTLMEARELAGDRYSVWHAWAVANYDYLKKADTKDKDGKDDRSNPVSTTTTTTTMDVIATASTTTNRPATAVGTAGRLASSTVAAGAAGAGTAAKPLSRRLSSSSGSASLLNILSSQQVDSVTSYIIEAIRGFVRSIILGVGQPVANVLQDTLRLITLWFSYGTKKGVFHILEAELEKISPDNWLAVVPQLIARIHIKSPEISGMLLKLLTKVATAHPQALVCPISVALNTIDQQQRIVSTEVLHEMRKSRSRLVEEATMVSRELMRVAITPHELWYDGLEQAAQLYMDNKDVTAMMLVLTELHEAMNDSNIPANISSGAGAVATSPGGSIHISGNNNNTNNINKPPAAATLEGFSEGIGKIGRTTLRDISFRHCYSKALLEAQRWLEQFRITHCATDLHQAWEIYQQLFKRIKAQIATLKRLELHHVSPALTNAVDLSLAVPGTYKPSSADIGIKSFSHFIGVIASKQRPRRMSMLGSDGKKYEFLLKGHEDLRQDERVMQLFGLINACLNNDNITNNRGLEIVRYSVLPLSNNSGVIGWVQNTDTMNQLVKQYREAKEVRLLVEVKLLHSKCLNYDKLPLIHKVDLFRQVLEETTGRDLAKMLWLKSKTSDIWVERRANFTKSMAVMSMVGYILGLGDRHPSNLMLDRISGRVVHIDFGDCFEITSQRSKFPEIIPFRLTRMLTNCMGPAGIQGSYRLTCERVMSVLRENRDSVMAMLEAFVYDPLISWRLLTNGDDGEAAGGMLPTASQNLQSRASNYDDGDDDDDDNSLRSSRSTIDKLRDSLAVTVAAGSGTSPSIPTATTTTTLNGGAGTLLAGDYLSGGDNTSTVLGINNNNSHSNSSHLLDPNNNNIGGGGGGGLMLQSMRDMKRLVAITSAASLLDVPAAMRRTISQQDFNEEGEPLQENLNARALEVINRIQAKLTGRDFATSDDSDELTVEAQVERLIMEATSVQNLCQLFTGWCPLW